MSQKLLDIMHRMKGTKDEYAMESAPSPDALINTLKVKLERWKTRAANQDRELAFLMPLAARMAIMYMALEQHEALRDQWDAFLVTAKLLEPELEDMIGATSRGLHVDLLEQHLSKNELYLNQLPKKLSLDSDE